MSDKETVKSADSGAIHISEDVVASIAALTAADVEGVAALSAGMDIGEWLGRKNLAKGVKITMQERTVFLDISLLVKYASSIPVVARHVQEKVKDAVESMTGLTVGEINIHVCGVAFDREGKKKTKP